jgi:glyoxylase-like metal-dependent hydrolase (beta-lactamase superfamily II)
MIRGLPSRFLLAAVAVLLTCPATASAQFGEGAPPGSPGREIIHLTGDLYRFRDVRHYGMFLHTPAGIIVVDPTSPDTAAWLKGELASRFDVPVRYVIYSHAHNDHAPGGAVFADTATFVGHENMATNLLQPADGAPLLPLEAHWDADGNGSVEESEAPDVYANNFVEVDLDGNGSLSRSEMWAPRFAGSPTPPPDIVYQDRMSITLGGKSVELHYTGINHTDGMTVVLFPEERMIYTVDHLTPKRLPRMTVDAGYSYLPDWIESLRRIEQLDFDYVSPGHESVGTKADVSEQARYMNDLVEAVSAALEAGQTREEIVESVRLEQYSHLMEYERSIANNVSAVETMLRFLRGR